MTTRAALPAAPAASPRRGERRRQILEAARGVFSKNGYDRASMAEIAAAVGVVEGAIYKHFPSKRDLLFACIGTWYGPLVESTREAMEGIRGTRNRLRFAIWRQLKSFAEEPGFCRLIIEEIRPRSDYHESVVRDLNRELTSIVLGIIREGVERGELRSDVSPTTARDVIHGGVEHLAWKALTGRGELEVERLADELTELVWRGLAVEGGDEASRAARLERLESRLEAQIERLEAVLASCEPGA